MGTSFAASVAVGPLLMAAPRRLARTLSLRHAVAYGPIAFVDLDAAAPPHGCVTADTGLLPLLAVCEAVTVGGGHVLAGDVELEVRRWWDPRPRPAPTTRADLETRAALLGTASVGELVRAPQEAAERLLGRGEGLTPAGDDLLAGFVATVHVLTGAVATAPPPWLAPLQGWLREQAPDRTTDLSARLLAHATRGEVVTPLAGVLRSLCSGDDVPGAAARLRRLGSSSGRELLRGVASGAAVVTRISRRAAA